MASHMRRCSGQLYLTLEVPPLATEEQIRSAYHAKAQVYHPDKLPPTASPEEKEQATERFQEIQDANEILMDPHRRRLYDIFGRAGMRTIEGGIGAEYADLIVSNLHRIRWVVLLIAYFFLMCGTEMVILVLEVDQKLGWDWADIFIPIWIIDVLLGGAALGLLYEMLRAPSKVPLFIMMFVTLTSIVLGTIFICLALDGSMTWHAAFIPVLVLLASYVIGELKSCDVRKFREELRLAGDEDADNITVTSQQYLAYVGTVLWRTVLLSMFVLMLYLRVTRQTEASYYWVFMPLFLWLWLPLVWRLFVICCTNRVVSVMSDRGILSFMLIFTYLNSFLTVGLLAVKCHQAEIGVREISLVYVMIPPLTMMVLLTMLFCGIALFLPSSMMQLGAADAFNDMRGNATSSDPLMQAHGAVGAANQMEYAANMAMKGEVGKASDAAKQGLRAAHQSSGYGTTEEMQTRS